MINPIATACIEISEGIPNKEHARGMSNKDPPATPEVPQAVIVEIVHNKSAVGKSTTIPNVWHTAKVITVIVTAAPAVFIVAPKGMLIE